jgi:hypothetical protein
MLDVALARDLLPGAYYLALKAFASLVYPVTLGCMFYCACSDPGQWKAADIDDDCDTDDEEAPSPPERAHKMWLYQHPIRRYDHYCRWLMNAIGLLNHREFALMLVGLMTIGTCGGLVDVALLISMPWDRSHGIQGAMLLSHLMYSMGVIRICGPIFRLHVGFVSRNELAQEWKNNEFYIAAIGEKRIPANDLDPEAFNEHFDHFVYDKTRNKFDKGMPSNCLSFWCTRRWCSQQGDF